MVASGGGGPCWQRVSQLGFTHFFNLLVHLYSSGSVVSVGLLTALLTPSHGSFISCPYSRETESFAYFCFNGVNIMHYKEKCEENSFIMRNAQMVSQKCALPAPVP